ncbi:hypothetical protein [Persicobacter sp. CCB-QB2]|uniref:hypothetical protein n=1 Tax=Persicobacter sp. CCB-QB2 TaxID=1561025 RepID=UPI0006A9B395|nr:hypothetical protein [Persicobacter sp. CCB-QB2]
MAREITEIQQELEQNINDVFETPSQSDAADWKLWSYIWAHAIWAFENIMQIFQNDVDMIINTKRYGTLAWYYDRIMEFQGADDGAGFEGDKLIVDEHGRIVFEVQDETRRIISRASVQEISGGIAVKLAKMVDDELEQLSPQELNAFEQYLRNVKYPGTAVNLISLSADIIRYDLNIYYDPHYSAVTVQQNIEAAIEQYRWVVGFDARFYKQQFAEYLMRVEGLISMRFNGLFVQTTTSDWTAIDVYHELESGYFNYQPQEGDNHSSITMINASDL